MLNEWLKSPETSWKLNFPNSSFNEQCSCPSDHFNDHLKSRDLQSRAGNVLMRTQFNVAPEENSAVFLSDVWLGVNWWSNLDASNKVPIKFVEMGLVSPFNFTVQLHCSVTLFGFSEGRTLNWHGVLNEHLNIKLPNWKTWSTEFEGWCLGNHFVDLKFKLFTFWFASAY